MAGRVVLDPTLVFVTAVASFILTGSSAFICWWCGCSFPCWRGRREDAYREEDDEGDEETGQPLGKNADKFLAEWEAKFNKSFKQPTGPPALSSGPALGYDGSGALQTPPKPPRVFNTAHERRVSANADQIVAMAQRRVAQNVQRNTVATDTRARRLSLVADDADKVIWTGHGSQSQQKTLSELRDIAKEEQQERMAYLNGFMNGDASRRRRQPKASLQERNQRSASVEPTVEAPRPRPPTASRAASAGADFSDLADSNDFADLNLTLPEGGSWDPTTMRSASAKAKRRIVRKEGTSSRRADEYDPTMDPQKLSIPTPQQRRRPSLGDEGPRATRRRSNNGEVAPRRVPRRQSDNAEREAPRKSKRGPVQPSRGRSTSPRPADEFGIAPPSLSTMPSKASTRRPDDGMDSRNPEWPGMMNF